MKIGVFYKKILLLIGTLLLSISIGCGNEKTPLDTDSEIVGEEKVLDYSFPKDMPTEEEISAAGQAEKLILSGQDIEPETIDRIQQQLPNCEIIYDIILNGKSFSNMERAVETDSFSQEDVQKLKRLPNLEYLNAGETECGAELEEFIASNPNIKVIYSERILGVSMRNIDTYLDLTGSTYSIEDIQDALSRYPRIGEVCLVNTSLENSEKAELHQNFPDVYFYYTVDVKGTEMKSTDTHLDFSRLFFDDGIEEVASILKCFMQPEWVDVSRQFFENSDMEWIQKQYPETVFAWIVPIGKSLNIRTDQEVFNGTESVRVLKTSDIQNLKYCKRMRAINLTDQEVQDISCLEGLEDVEYLRIGGNSISDLSALRNMKKLKYLEIYGNGISDISVLENCESLEDINLNRNSITDITPLLKLKNLKCIYISQNPVSTDQDAINALQAQFPDAEIVCNRESSRGGFADTKRSVHVDSIFKGRIYMEED